MTDGNKAMIREKTAGDVAVDGILAGVGAGVVSAVFLLVAGLVAGEGPGIVLARFDPALKGSALSGTLLHLGISAVYGALFATLYRPVVRRWPHALRLGWLLGLAYGFILLLLAEGTLQSGLNSGLMDVPAVQFAVFHLLYGLVLGFILGGTKTPGELSG